jgi:hypothetical protein
VLSDHFVRDRAPGQGDLNHATARRFDRLADGLGDLVRLAGGKADASLTVADGDERVEREAPPTLDDLGDTVDRDNVLDQVIPFAIAAPAPVTATVAATSTVTAAAWTTASAATTTAAAGSTASAATTTAATGTAAAPSTRTTTTASGTTAARTLDRCRRIRSRWRATFRILRFRHD